MSNHAFVIDALALVLTAGADRYSLNGEGRERCRAHRPSDRTWFRQADLNDRYPEILRRSRDCPLHREARRQAAARAHAPRHRAEPLGAERHSGSERRTAQLYRGPLTPTSRPLSTLQEPNGGSDGIALRTRPATPGSAANSAGEPTEGARY